MSNFTYLSGDRAAMLGPDGQVRYFFRMGRGDWREERHVPPLTADDHARIGRLSVAGVQAVSA